MDEVYRTEEDSLEEENLEARKSTEEFEVHSILQQATKGTHRRSFVLNKEPLAFKLYFQLMNRPEFGACLDLTSIPNILTTIDDLKRAILADSYMTSQLGLLHEGSQVPKHFQMGKINAINGSFVPFAPSLSITEALIKPNSMIIVRSLAENGSSNVDNDDDGRFGLFREAESAQ